MVAKKNKIRAAIVFEFKLKKKATECHQNICAAFGEDAISYSRCRVWYDRFKNGDEALENELHGIVFDNQLLLNELDVDPSQTSRQLAEKFDCSHSTIESH